MMATSIEQQIAALMAQAGAMSYSPPSTYKGYQRVMATPIKLTPIDLTPWNFTTKDFKSLVDQPKKKKSKSWVPNLWDVLSGTLGQAGGVLTSSVYDQVKNALDPHKTLTQKIVGSFFNTPGAEIVKGIKHGGIEQWKDWTDGGFSYGDIPGIGFLHGMDRGWKRGTDIAKDELHIKNKLAQNAVGIGLDIALDPLTYFSGGATIATKAGKVAELAKMTEAAKALGIADKVKNAKNANEFIAAAKDALTKGYKAKVHPDVSDSLISRLVDSKLAKVAQDIKNARNEAYNANITKWGASIPFSNKASVAFGEMPKWSPIARIEAKLGSEYAHVADDLFKAHGVEDRVQQAKILEKMFGKTKAEDLTKTEVGALSDNLKTAAAKLAEHNGKYRNLVDAVIHEVGVLKPKEEIIAPPSLKRVTNALGDGKPPKMPKREIERLIRTATIKTGNSEAAKHAKSIEDFINKDVVMSNAKTKFEHFLDKHNPFDARTLKTGDKYLDSMANEIADANSQRVGERAKYVRGLSKIQKYVKGKKLTSQEMKEAIYAVEGKAPKSYGENWTPSERVKGLADLIRPLVSQIGKDEVAAGILSKLRKNYFPHVLNMSNEDMKKIEEFMKRHPELNDLKGVSSENKFNRSRKSFPTLADAENYISRLEKAIQKETDSGTIESLRQQQEAVANLFNTDVVSALTRRVGESVRAKAMKAMQGELDKYGMLKVDPKEVPSGLQELGADEAKKLGLNTNKKVYIHPKVLEGLKRVDEIFTNQGMNKFARALSAISDIWRPLVTFYKPAHYRNNLIGNVFNNLAAGVRVKDYKAAAALIKGYRSGKLTEAQMKIMDAAYKHNVISGGFLFDADANYHFETPWKIEKFARKVGNNRVINKPRVAGEVLDDVTRLANFVSGMDKFGNVKKAAQQVREYLFNYNELTNADRAVRVAVPFWNWIKRNIPLQVKLLMDNPKYAMSTERFRQVFNNDQDGQDWQKETGIKIPGMNYYTTVPSPTNDLNQVLDPPSLEGSIHPLAKALIELRTNKNLFTGNPISYGSNSVQPSDIPGYIISNMLGGRDAYKLANQKLTIPEFLTTLFNPISQINKVGQGGN